MVVVGFEPLFEVAPVPPNAYPYPSLHLYRHSCVYMSFIPMQLICVEIVEFGAAF